MNRNVTLTALIFSCILLWACDFNEEEVSKKVLESTSKSREVKKPERHFSEFLGDWEIMINKESKRSVILDYMGEMKKITAPEDLKIELNDSLFFSANLPVSENLKMEDDYLINASYRIIKNNGIIRVLYMENVKNLKYSILAEYRKKSQISN